MIDSWNFRLTLADHALVGFVIILTLDTYACTCVNLKTPELFVLCSLYHVRLAK